MNGSRPAARRIDRKTSEQDVGRGEPTASEHGDERERRPPGRHRGRSRRAGAAHGQPGSGVEADRRGQACRRRAAGVGAVRRHRRPDRGRLASCRPCRPPSLAVRPRSASGARTGPASGPPHARLAPEVRGPRVVRARDARRRVAPGAIQSCDVAVPGPRPELGLERVDPPAAAGPRVEQPGRVDRRARRRAACPVMNHSGRRVARPGARPAARPGVDPSPRRRPSGGVNVGDRLALREVADERPPQRRGGGQRRRRLRERGFEWSLLPIQMPDREPGQPAGSFGGAR